MSAPCSDSFRAMAEGLGGISCEDANPLLTLRSPAALASWTMPIVELLMIGGAVLALVHAIRLRRHTGNPANLALWCAAVVFVFALEPPLYFPHQLGFADHLELIFVHNVFSVQLLYDRLPLYIVALYPAGIYLAYSLVDGLQVFERRSRFVGALSVGFIHHCFYAIFDHLGPQLRWWAWNPDVPINRPALGSVPLVSTVFFGLVAPALLAFALRVLVVEPLQRRTLGGLGVAARTVVSGLLTPVLLSIAGSPVSYLMIAQSPNRAVMAAVLCGAVVLSAFVAIPALAQRGEMAPTASSDRFLDRYALLHGAAYLGVFALLWSTSLPELLAAEGGWTANGTPIGNPAYVVACAAFCLWVLRAASRRSSLA